jgi:hypothetical protein
MQFWQKYYAKMFLLPALAVLMFVLLSFRFLFKANGKVNVRTLLAQAWKRVVPLVFSSAVNLFTFLVSNSVSPFNCVSHESDGQKSFIMAINPVENCYEGAWNYHLPFVIAFSLLYAVFFPLVILSTFYANRRAIDDPKFVSGYGSLIFLYGREYFFWELISMLKRAAFVIMTQFLTAKENQYSTKFAASISTIGFFSALEILLIPYATQNLNLLSST